VSRPPNIMRRKVAVPTDLAIFILTIIALLITRQILVYNNDTESRMFVMTIIIGYGFGSWILLGYIKQVKTLEPNLVLYI